MAVKICKGCGESNPENAHLCVVCSSSLKEAPTFGTPDADKQLTGVLTGSRHTCWYCSEKTDEGALKCKFCGSTLMRPSRPAGSGYTYYGSSGSSPGGCAVVLLFVATLLVPIVGLIVGGIFAFSDDPGKQDIGKALLVFGLIVLLLGIVVGAFFL
ncbi:zinc ribbon domain-containing protein [Paenibacillus hamazuiensis]|uniref:zinc ribbon domain-containing protein n=1 Tax=Paenibacillus hamazuiensis TaxID=2936508 RepID=UPI00200F601C|nr:zinc ribbon domain-containing protein [Paenibacillus hamazuiensis]